jgi:hypothetical protein
MCFFLCLGIDLVRWQQRVACRRAFVLFVCVFEYLCIYQVRSVECQQRVGRRIAHTMELQKNLIKARLQDFADKQARAGQTRVLLVCC